MSEYNVGKFLNHIKTNFRSIDGSNSSEKNSLIEKDELKAYYNELNSKDNKSKEDEFIIAGLQNLIKPESDPNSLWTKLAGADNGLSENEIEQLFNSDTFADLSADLDENNLSESFQANLTNAVDKTLFVNGNIPRSLTGTRLIEYLDTARDEGALPEKDTRISVENIDNSLLADDSSSYVLVQTRGDFVQDSGEGKPSSIAEERDAFGGIDSQDNNTGSFIKIDKRELSNFLKESNQYLKEKFPDKNVSLELSYLKNGVITPVLKYQSNGVEIDVPVNDDYLKLKSELTQERMSEYSDGNFDANILTHAELAKGLTDNILEDLKLDGNSNEIDQYLTKLKNENPDLSQIRLDHAHGAYSAHFLNSNGDVIKELSFPRSDLDKKGLISVLSN